MNLAQNLFTSAEKYPGNTLVVFYDRRLRYEECAQKVSLLAAAFADRGLGPGKRMAIALPNVPEFVLVYYAALSAGVEIVPVNPLYTPHEIDFMFRDADVSMVITHPMFEQSLRGAIGEKDIELLFSDNLGDPAKLCVADLIAAQKTGMSPVEKQEDDVAVVAYTNAYQGRPLGAQLTHGGLDFDADRCRLVSATAPGDAFLSIIPLYHAFSATVCMNLPICSGAMTILNETFSEKRVVEIIESEKIAIFPAVPTIFYKLYEVYGGAGKDLSNVKAFIPGGAPMPLDLIQKFIRAFNAMIFEGYGITECGPVTSVNPISKKIVKHGSIGPPLQDIYVKVCDPAGNELPARQQGELWVKGNNVMKGYLNQPEITSKFLTDGWFHTGDRAWLDEEGFIFLTGLIKRMILVGGFNVYPVEVENALLEHPDVEECEVFGDHDDALGQRVVAKVKLKPGGQENATKLRKFARAKLAPYKVPRAVEFI